MLALSVMPYFAEMIMIGNKTIECRSWRTDYRGDIVICSTADRTPDIDTPIIPGHALCVVELFDIRAFTAADMDAALLLDTPAAGAWAWLLRNPRPIVPMPVKGRQRLWQYDHDCRLIPLTGSISEISDAEFAAVEANYWRPLYVAPAPQ